VEPALAAGKSVTARTSESSSITACRLHDLCAGCGIHIASRGSNRVQRSRGSSASPTPASSGSPGGQKNRLRDLRSGAARLVRSQAAPGARSLVRRPAHLPRVRGAPRGLSALWHGEAGAARLPGRQSLLHQALRLLRGPALSGLADPGRRQGAASRRAHREGARAAVHARATAPRRDARPAGPRDRRGLDPQGAHLPHCRQRSPAAAADLGKAARVRLAVMDMWKAFRLSTARHAHQASILFDKFHALRHLGDALDQVRKSEYARVSGRQRRFIEGQKTRSWLTARPSPWTAAGP